MKTLFEHIDETPEVVRRHHPSAYEALESYASLPFIQERPDFIEHAHRTEDLVHVFAGDLIADRVYDTVMLHDIAERAITSKHDDQREAAAIILADYFTNPTLDDTSRDFVACVLGDMVHVEQAAESYRKHLGAVTDNPVLQDALIGNRKAPLPTDLWLVKEPVVDIEHLKQICEDVNIESIIIKAAEVLDNIVHPPKREAAVLQDILEIETFHAPLCEVLGLDALAMKLRSEANKQRLVRSGYENEVTQAEELNAYTQSLGSAWVFERLFGKTPQKATYETHDTSPHPEPIMYGEVPLSELDESAAPGSLRYRVKSIGSLAKKLTRDPSLPMDIFGLTVVMDNPRTLGAYFAETLERFQSLPEVSLAPAPSKQEAVYIQGCPRYIASITEALPPELLERTQVKKFDSDPNSVYQVCKMTFYIEHEGHKLPAEMQFVTRPDRRNARVGQTAHILFKQQHESGRDDVDYQQLAQFLQTIYDRKKFIDSDGVSVNERSFKNGQTLLSAIETALNRSSPTG